MENTSFMRVEEVAQELGVSKLVVSLLLIVGKIDFSVKPVASVSRAKVNIIIKFNSFHSILPPSFR